MYLLLIFLICLIAGGSCGLVAQHTGLANALNNSEHLSADQLGEGVEVDESFIPIPSDQDSYPSSKGCPSTTDGYPWVKFGTPARCYLTGFQGPCPLHMKLFYNLNSPEFGYCQCDCFDNDPTSGNEYYCMRKATEWDFETELRAYGFYSETKSCYPLFSQGPCKSDEWFVMDSSTEKISTCEKRRCRHPRDSNELIFFSNGTKSCEKLGEECKSECRPEMDVNQDQGNYRYKFSFVRETWIPQCIMYESLGGGGGFVASVGELKCEDGSTFSKLLHKCVTPFKKFGGAIG